MNHSLASLIEGSCPIHRTDSKHDVPDCSGIYVLVCTKTGKPYVGRSVNLRQRFKEHHKPGYARYNGKKLSNAKKKYGQDSFVFYVVELCSVDDINEREDFYIDELDSVRNGYNSLHNSDVVDRWSPCDATRNKISQSLKEYHKHTTNPFKGKKHSNESRALIKKNMRNDDGSFKSSFNKDSMKKKIIMIDKDSDVELAVFFSLKDANIFREKSNVYCPAIGYAASGRNKTSFGFKWKYLNI